MIILDWPIPPSNNNLTRSHGKFGKPSYHPTVAYTKWKKAADALTYMQKPRGGFKTITGPYRLVMTVDRQKLRSNADLGNREKAAQDHLKRVGVIADDKNAIEILVRFGEAPEGCRLTVIPA